MNLRAAALAALGAGVLVAGPLSAQGGLRWAAAMSGVGMRVKSGTAPTPQKLSGAVFGIEGHLGIGRRIVLDLGYWQGQLTPASGQQGVASRDVVEGYALLGLRPLSWLTVRGGPHAWTYISTAGTQRWFLVEGRVRAHGELLPDVSTWVELWDVVSAEVNVSQRFQSGLGGEGGLSLRLRDVPVLPHGLPTWIRLAYGIERIRLSGGVRTEVVDRLALSLSIAGY